MGELERCWTTASRVLEVGSGTGCYTLLLARAVREVVAVDCSSAMRRYLERRLLREGIPNVEVRQGCLPNGVEGPGEFDGVLGVGVLNYVVDLEASLVSLADVLAPSGWCVLTVPADTREGRLYQRDELLTRRRVYLRSDADVHSAATAAGLRVDGLTMAGGFTRVFRASSV
jgi:protein-L-isoaspartate O-methyltransferase